MDDNIADINSNVKSHNLGIKACTIFEEYYLGKEVPLELLTFFYSYLTRDFICVSNTSAYETLKSRGIQIIQNDSLRFLISHVFNFRYENIIKLEEQYEESQFFKNYEKVIRDSFGHMMIYNKEENDYLESSIDEFKKDSLITLLINSPCHQYIKDYWIQSDLVWLPNTNPQFLNDQIIWTLRRIKYNRKFMIQRYTNTLSDLRKLQVMIEDELLLYDLS